MVTNDLFMRIPESELILNPDGSVYHLNLLPYQIASDIITVGDPDRVDAITQHFDYIEHTVHKREFKTVTGVLEGKRLSVISTGIGTDNIDIVFNELDALVNVNLESRMVKEKLTTLNFYRIGTSGAIRGDVPVDSIIISRYAIGLDGLMNYYRRQSSPAESSIAQQAKSILSEDLPEVNPYGASASPELIHKYSTLGRLGITTTATGFYGPQGRSIRMTNKSNDFLDKIAIVEYDDLFATNLEMETAGIYGLASALGHKAISLNAILANRVNGTFSAQPNDTVNGLIKRFLEIWSTS